MKLSFITQVLARGRASKEQKNDSQELLKGKKSEGDGDGCGAKGMEIKGGA